MDTPIFLLHGLGGHTSTLVPLELYLNYFGFLHTYNLYYPVDKMDFEDTLNYVDKEIEKFVSKNQEIILIGQSMGGVVSNQMHTKGWHVKIALYIGSPLHGASLLNQLETILPTKIVNMVNKKPYDFLKNHELVAKYANEPPHPYKTISMGWINSEFDGCVYKNETMFNEKNHLHLQWADHRTIFANPRLWFKISELIR